MGDLKIIILQMHNWIMTKIFLIFQSPIIYRQNAKFNYFFFFLIDESPV